MYSWDFQITFVQSRTSSFRSSPPPMSTVMAKEVEWLKKNITRYLPHSITLYVYRYSYHHSNSIMITFSDTTSTKLTYPVRYSRTDDYHSRGLEQPTHGHLQLSLNRKGRWGTTDDFTTSLLHFPMFSTALWDLVNSRPVHSLMLSSHLFLLLSALSSSPFHCALQDGFGQI